jgi:hypothetical protein
MDKECCAYREAALAAGKNSQMTAVPLTGLWETWHVSNVEHANLRVELPIVQNPLVR